MKKWICLFLSMLLAFSCCSALAINLEDWPEVPPGTIPGT